MINLNIENRLPSFPIINMKKKQKISFFRQTNFNIQLFHESLNSYKNSEAFTYLFVIKRYLIIFIFDIISDELFEKEPAN